MKRGILFFIIISTAALSTNAQPLNPTTPISTVLPVKLTSFTGEAVNGASHLSWQTAQELNSSVFEVEYSRDGEHWTTTGSVKAAGNSYATRQYSYIHTQPGAGQNYYRLKTVDLDDTWELSATIRITINVPAGIRIYPVPVSDYLEIEVSSFREQLPYTIINAKGEEMKRGIITQKNQRIAVQDLTRGLYLFKTYKFEPVKFLK